MKLKLLFIVAFIGITISSCSDITNGSTGLKAKEQIAIPEGYKLIGASAYGQFANNFTLYIENNENGHVYECKEGKIGTKITVPAGHKVVAVSAYGRFVNIVTFYCLDTTTNKIVAYK